MSEPYWVPLGAAPLSAVGYGTALPSSPVDGQEFVLVDSLTNPSYQWRFRYNAGSSSAYKWEFVGGSPQHMDVDASGASAGTAFAAIAGGPTIVIPVAGDYIIEHGFDAASSVATNILLMSYDIGATVASDNDACFGHPTTTSGLLVSVMRRRRKNALPAVTLTAKYRQSAANSANYERRWMSATPVRIG